MDTDTLQHLLLAGLSTVLTYGLLEWFKHRLVSRERQVQDDADVRKAELEAQGRFREELHNEIRALKSDLQEERKLREELGKKLHSIEATMNRLFGFATRVLDELAKHRDVEAMRKELDELMQGQA